MASFGHYVTVRELRRTGLTVVYSGRDEKSLEEKFAIKVLDPSVMFADKELEKIGANQFLNSAQLQQKVVAGGAQHWVPIHGHGSSRDGTFYVADKYERSLQELIDGHVGLSAKGLHAIVVPIVEGLIELKKAYKRPHGNLKATNVLITGAISEMKVGLSDPLPDELIDAKVHWHADLRAIGELIYQLVVRRPAPSLDSAWISGSKEWARLKKQAKAWRELCGRLLAVRIKPEAINLEGLVEELTELGKSKPVLTRRRLAVLSLLFFIAIAVVIYFYTKPPSVSPEQWTELCNDYSKWVQPLYNNLGFTVDDKKSHENSIKNGPARIWLVKDPNLVNIIGKERNDEDSRIWAAGLPGRVTYYKADPNYLTKEAVDAVKAVKSIRSFFDPNTDGDPNWPTLKKIHEAAISLEKKEEGWLKPAALYLNNLVDRVRPPSPEIFQGVNGILDLKEKGIRKIQDDIDSLREDVGQYTNGKRVKVYKEVSGIAKEYSMIETSEKFDSYLKEICGFRNIENLHEEYERKWGPIYTRTSRLVENLKSMTENKENAYNLENRLKDLKTNFDELKKNLEEEGLYYIAKNEDSIKKRYEELMGNLQNLWDGIVKDLDHPSDWLRDLDGRRVTNFESLHEKWQKRQEELLPEDTRIKLQSDDYLAYTSVEPNVEASWDRLNKLQKLGTILFQDFEEQLRPFHEKMVPIDELTMGYRNALEEAFQEIEDNEFFDNFAPAIPDINEPSSLEYPLWHKLAQFNLAKGSSAKNLVDLVREYCDLHEQFRLFYLLEDKRTEECVEIFEDRLKKLKADEVFSEIFTSGSKVSQAFSTLESKIDKIRNITNMRHSDLRSQADKIFGFPDLDYEALFAVYVGFEKPSGDPNWPKDPKEWDLDQKMKKLLQERVGAIQDKSNRAKQLKDELEDIFAKRKELFEKLKPPYCERLDRYRQNDENILVFAKGINLSEKFEPVMDANGNPIKVGAWDEIRQAVNNKQKEWMEFFYTTDISDSINVGWPKYIRSTIDPNVILRFIPAGNGNLEPFYMAIREITNAQYENFLSKNKAEGKERAYYDNNDNILLIRERYPPYSLYWDNNKELKEYPVTYVTYYGAQSYATWLAAQLPSDKQHEFAFRAASGDTLPWSDQSQILTFAHVRARPWQIAAKQFNDATATEDKPRPLGAKQSDKDYNGGKKLIIERVVIPADPPYKGSAWPIVSSTESNKWGLYDMVGNVWEWCSDKSICGGSCLAPPEYIPGNRDYVSENYSTTFKDRSARDVGFRVIVPIQ